MCKLRCDIKVQAAVVRTQADRLRDPSSDLAGVAHRRRLRRRRDWDRPLARPLTARSEEINSLFGASQARVRMNTAGKILRLKMASDSSSVSKNQKHVAVTWLKKHIIGVCIVVEVALIFLLFDPRFTGKPHFYVVGLFRHSDWLGNGACFCYRRLSVSSKEESAISMTTKHVWGAKFAPISSSRRRAR